MRKIIYMLVFVLLLSTQAFGKSEISQFKNFDSMINSFGDYYMENASYQKISKDHFRLSPTVFGSDKAMILEEAKRAFLYGVYRTFIHTKRKSIQVTVIPLDFRTKKPYKDLSFTATIKRSQALKIANDLLETKSFNDLVGISINGMFIADSWSNKMNKALFNDQGYPTLNLFFKKLADSTK